MIFYYKGRAFAVKNFRSAVCRVSGREWPAGRGVEQERGGVWCGDRQDHPWGGTYGVGVNKTTQPRWLGCGGKTGIRTLGTRKGTTVFETVPIDRSGIFP